MSQQASTSGQPTKDSPLRLVIKNLQGKRTGGKRSRGSADIESPSKAGVDKKSRIVSENESVTSSSESEAEMISVDSEPEKVKGNKKKSKRSKKSSQPELNPTMIQVVKEAVRSCMEEMMPQIIGSINETITESVKVRLDELDERVAVLSNKAEQSRVLSVIESDRQEQFQRRDNILIQGIKEVEQETTDMLVSKVVELCDSIGVKVEKPSIGDIHRLGKKGARSKARPVLVKTNRLVKSSIMQSKRRLRDVTNMDKGSWEDKIMIYEDLTDARRKLREVAKDAPDVSFCYSRDGTIVCKTTDGRWVDINNYNDLLKVGVQGENLEPSRYYKGLV